MSGCALSDVADGVLADASTPAPVRFLRQYDNVFLRHATRLASVEVLDDEKAASAAGFLRRAVAHFRAHGIVCEGTPLQ